MSSLSGIEEFVAKEPLLVEAVGRDRGQPLCPRHPAGRGCALQHRAQGVGHGRVRNQPWPSQKSQ